MGYPEVIILDEPTVGLDPKQIIEIRTLIKNLKEKHTVILSSHILSEVSAVCDYVLIISHGKLVASDTPDNLSRLAAGSNKIEMLVKGEKETIEHGLKEVPGMNDVEIAYDQEQNLWSVRVTADEQTDIREQIFYKMSELNSPILEMKSKKVSLEEIFLELTESEERDSEEMEDSAEEYKEEVEEEEHHDSDL